MTPQSSLFLDTARFLAALVVLLSHLTFRDVNGAFPWVPWANEAVVVFFVISGYVIGYVADTRENSLAEFAAARLGRLYSVVVPALALTFILDSAGMAAAPWLYDQNDHQLAGLRILANLLFLQQSWNATVVPLSNGPFWSLAYEFWYYAIFAAWHFTRGKTRLAWVSLAMLCAGPRILASLPVWLLGLAAYHASRHWHPRAAARAAMFAACASAFVLLASTDHPWPWLEHLAEPASADGTLAIGGLRLFLGDIPQVPYKMLLGLLFSVMVFCLQGPLPGGAWQTRAAETVRYLAGSTFSLYLFHVPIIYFLAAAFGVRRDSASGILFTGVATIVACIALSHLFERRAAQYRRFFRSALQLLPGDRKSGASNAHSPLESTAWTKMQNRNR